MSHTSGEVSNPGPRTPVLKLAAGALRAIEQEALRAYPLEACGVLAGHEDAAGAHIATRAIVCHNAAGDPRRRYWIEPRELVAVQRSVREAGEVIVGFFHSHPGAPAGWSATDAQEAYWTDCVYLVVSVVEGSVTATAAFLPQAGGRVTRVVIEPFG